MHALQSAHAGPATTPLAGAYGCHYAACLQAHPTHTSSVYLAAGLSSAFVRPAMSNSAAASLKPSLFSVPPTSVLADCGSRRVAAQSPGHNQMQLSCMDHMAAAAFGTSARQLQLTTLGVVSANGRPCVPPRRVSQNTRRHTWPRSGPLLRPKVITCKAVNRTCASEPVAAASSRRTASLLAILTVINGESATSSFLELSEQSTA